MKTLLTLLLLLAVTANAQFRRESDKKVYPYATTPQSNDVFIIGRPGVTNYNLAQSNALAYIYGVNTNNTTLIASNQAWMATNGYAPTVTNIVTYIYTNSFAPTNTGIAGQVLHSVGSGSITKWDYVNQALTNSNPVVPDFHLPVNYWQTNAAFLFLSPANVDTTGTKLQVTDCIVTNSTAAAVAVTFPASIHVTGTAYVTNVSVFHFRQFAGKWTNCVCEPVW